MEVGSEEKGGIGRVRDVYLNEDACLMCSFSPLKWS